MHLYILIHVTVLCVLYVIFVCGGAELLEGVRGDCVSPVMWFTCSPGSMSRFGVYVCVIRHSTMING